MSLYDVLLLLHIFGVAIWFGGGVMLLILGARLTSARDKGGLESLFRQANFIAMKVFTPIGLFVFAMGVWLVIEGPWTFDMLWVVLGLAGFAAAFVTGLFVLRPKAEAIASALGRDGGMTDDSAAATADMFRHMRIDYAVIAAVIVDMVLKPTGDDIGALVLIAAIVLIVIGTTVFIGREKPSVEQRV